AYIRPACPWKEFYLMPQRRPQACLFRAPGLRIHLASHVRGRLILRLAHPLALYRRSALMATTVWKGHLTFGLISMPVRMSTAARGERISFNQLHKECHSRLKQPLLCPVCTRNVT